MNLYNPPAQADSYAEYPRRAMLVKRVAGMLERYYPAENDPYRIFEREIAGHLKADYTLLDAGCGRSAPVLSLFAPQVARAIGVDSAPFAPSLSDSGMELLNHELSHLPLPDGSVDIVISRSVVEHLKDPASAYAEVSRILKPGGKFIFITPNVWSYPILAARMIPNGFHAAILNWAEGRPRHDTFDTYHRSNSLRAIRKLASRAGFEVSSFRYLSAFPHYLMFHPLAFLLGVGYERVISRVGFLAPLRHCILGVLTKALTGPAA